MRWAILALAAAALWVGPASADPAGLDHAVTGVTDSFLDKGVVGAVAVLAIVVAGFLGWALRTSQEARIADAREVNKESTEALKVNAEAMFKLGAIVDKSASGADERWRTLGGLLEALTPIQTDLASNKSSLGRMETDIRDIRNQGDRR